MKEEILKQIKEETEKELKNLDEYNAYARLRNKKAKEEEIKASLGLLHNIHYNSIYLSEKTESDIIMEIYKKYASLIKENETNNIFIYNGTYMYTNPTLEEIEEGYPFQIEVESTDSRATHKYYQNLEGYWSERIDIEECEEFERNHTVIYYDNYKILVEFLKTAMKENQQTAVKQLLLKYPHSKTKKEIKIQ